MAGTLAFMELRGVLSRGWRFVVDVLRRSRDDRVTGLAAEVAFFALLGLLPAMLALASILGSLDSLFSADLAGRVEDSVVDFFERVFTTEANGPVDSIRALFRETRPGVLTVSLLAALWAVGRSFAAVIRGLDLVYDSSERRSWLATRITALALGLVSTVATAVLLILIVVGPLIGPGDDVADALGAGSALATAWDWFRLPITVVVLVAWAATVFHIAPSRRTPWRWEVPGALVAAAWWGIVTFGFRVYLAVVGGGNDVTGALGGAVAVVFWLYLLAIGFLLGGEVNSVLAHRGDVVEDRRSFTGDLIGDLSERISDRWPVVRSLSSEEESASPSVPEGDTDDEG